MLDQFSIFTRGGVLLWSASFAAVKGDPVNALIKTCLLEDRTGESAFTYNAPLGGSYTVKWLLNNKIGVVLVAVYQGSLKLTYVEQLLEQVNRAFSKQYDVECPVESVQDFRRTFDRLVKEAEASKDTGGPGKKEFVALEAKATEHDDGSSAGQHASTDMSRHCDDENEEDADHEEVNEKDSSNRDQTDQFKSNTAFNAAMLNKKFAKKSSKKTEEAMKKKSGQKGKKARQWGEWGMAPMEKVSEDALDFTESGPEDELNQVEDFNKLSLVDADEEEGGIEEGEIVQDDSRFGQKGSSLLSSFVRNIGVNVMGTDALTVEDIQTPLQDLKKKLMERNVAEEIANKVIESVNASLVGQKLGSFTRVSFAVKQAVEEALTRILTPKRSIDILKEVKDAKSRGKPYVIVFVGVNGVGKSTNLAKIAYWLLQNKYKVMIAACDTFRSGAVEQLKTHCARLSVPLYERGYEKDPAKVAFEATKAAQKAGCDVVLVDTAGRMQDNEPLMRALSNLISFNSPDLVLFVGEALVGNDAVDQLTKFNRRLADLAPGPNPHLIDGIVLTKFDTIDDKVGAALSMVYTSGAPIVFVGCGQTYIDLKKLNVKSVVHSLLK